MNPVFGALCTVLLSAATLFLVMFRSIEGRWPNWFIMPWMRLSKNYPIARLLANSIRSNVPPWSGGRCSGLSAQLGAEWSWDTEEKPDRATINGATIKFNPLEAMIIRRALAERRRESAATAIHDALSKFVTDATR